MIIVKNAVAYNYCNYEMCNNYGGPNCPNDVCGFDTPDGSCNCDVRDQI